ncbi:MAG: hypothetical protein OYL97_11310 [Candidatus Poribacteria bacterium]|nr:hypothetical protein [Candidatus Poribacteria bacterium]
MKLRLGNVLIETDYIEVVERVSPHTVKVFFVSGKVLDVHCGIKSNAAAFWDQDANGFIQTIHNTDAIQKYGGNPPS